MKYFLVIFLFTATYVFSQKAEFGIVGSYGQDKLSNKTYLGGLNLEVYVTDGLSLNYSLKAGASDLNGFTMQSTMGMLGGSTLFLMGLMGDDDFYTLAIIAFIIPEGITYNFKPDDKTAISPYINLLSMEYTEHYIKGYYEAGIKFKKYFDSIYINLNVGVQSAYHRGTLVGNVGGGIGFAIY